MTRPRSFGLLAALALALLGGYMLAQQTRTFETEVRINARQLEDGRIEFALQQREGNGWGERILPRQRLFPADPGNDRWLNSSPVRISGVAASTGTIEQSGSLTDEAEEATHRYLVEIVRVRPVQSSSGRIGYQVNLRNNTDRTIRSVGVRVQARNNVGVVSLCDPQYEYICDTVSSSYSWNLSVDRSILSGGTITLGRSNVRGWNTNDDIETMTVEIAQVEFRSGTPASWSGCPSDSSTQFYCPGEKQSVTIRLD